MAIFHLLESSFHLQNCVHEYNFLVEKTKKIKAELSQVRAQLERTSSAKLDEMLSF